MRSGLLVASAITLAGCGAADTPESLKEHIQTSVGMAAQNDKPVLLDPRVDCQRVALVIGSNTGEFVLHTALNPPADDDGITIFIVADASTGEVPEYGTIYCLDQETEQGAVLRGADGR